MRKAGWVTLFYSLIVFFGGLMGHLRAGSSISLIMGIAFGVLLLLAAIGMLRDKLLPTYFGLILILMLDAFFTYRWMMTFHFIPSGLMTIISVAVLISVVLLVRDHLKNPKKGR